MRNKLTSSVFFLISAYAYLGVIMLTEHYISSWEIFFTILLWFGQFGLVLFILCYKSFYKSFGSALLMALFAYVMSLLSTFIVLAIADKLAPSLNSYRFDILLDIAFYIFWALPLPYCYLAWYIDNFFAGRNKNSTPQ